MYKGVFMFLIIFSNRQIGNHNETYDSDSR